MNQNPAAADESDPLTNAGDRAALRAAFQAAFDEMGGVATLAEWACANRTQFYALFARLCLLAAPAPSSAAQWGEAIVSDEPLLTEAEWEQVKGQLGAGA